MRIYDINGNSLRLDRSTGGILTIEYDHHEIHAGSHFMFTDSVELDAAAIQNYLITTPDTTKWCHFTFSATGSAITHVEFFKDTDRIGTTLQEVFNNNQNSDTVAGLTVHKGVSGGTTDGTRIYTLKSGAAAGASRTPVAFNRGNEIVLKQNTKYIMRVTSGTNDNLTNVEFEWYEHTNIV